MRRVVASTLAACLVVCGADDDARAQCNNRPTDPAGYMQYIYGGVEVKTFATKDLLVHYATSGTHAADLATTRGDSVPDSVAFAGEDGQRALDKYAEVGFRKVPSDAACVSNGGDGKLDIYLVKFAAGGDGTTVAECPGGACSSFVLVDSTFKGRGYKTIQEGFGTVVPHELFHAVQNVYDPEQDTFWAEGTAQWAMHVLHPEYDDFIRQMPAYFTDTTRSLDMTGGGVTAGFLYGSAVWPLFLDLKFGTATIREVFEAQATGKKSIAAVEAVLHAKSSSLAETYPVYCAWNASTKTYAGTGGFPDGAKYPGVKTIALEDGAAGITSGLGYFVYLADLPGKQQITLETDATRNGGVVVPLEGGKANLDKIAKLPTNVDGQALVIVAGITTKKTDAKFTLHLGPPDENASSSSSGGGSSSSSGGCSCTESSSSTSPVSSLFSVAALSAIVGLGLLSKRWRKRD